MRYGQRMTLQLGALVAVFLVGIPAGPCIAQNDALERLAEQEKTLRLDLHRHSFDPEPISSSQFTAWADEIELDDDQRAYLKELTDRYRTQADGLLKKHRKEIEQRWIASFRYDRDRREVVPIYTPVLLELYEEHGQLLEGLMEAEAAFFDMLRRALSGPQSDRSKQLQIVRLRSLLEQPMALVEENLDLHQLVGAIEWSELDAAAIAPLMRDYDDDMLRLFTARTFVTARSMEYLRAEVMVDLGPGWNLTLSAEDEARLKAQMGKLYSSGFNKRGGLSPGGLNWEYVDRIASRVSKGGAIAIRSAFYLRLNPDFFEPQKSFFDLASSMRAMLVEQEAIVDSLDDALDRTLERLEPVIRDAMTLRAAELSMQFDPTLPGTDDQTVARLAHAVDTILVEQKRDEVLDSAAQTLAPIVSSDNDLGNAMVDTLASYRRTMRYRQEASEYLLNGLQNRLEQVQQRIRFERERDANDSVP